MVVWLVNGIYLAALAKVSAPLFWLADVCQWIFLPSALLIYLARKASLLPKHYGLDTAALRWQSPFIGTLMVFVTGGIAFYEAQKISWMLLGYPRGIFSFDLVFPAGLMGGVCRIYSAVTAGVVESIFFIGLPWLLYRHIRTDASTQAFSALVSIVFALAHWEQGPHVVIGAGCFNLVACFWCFRLGSLWPVVTGHLLIDLVAFA